MLNISVTLRGADNYRLEGNLNLNLVEEASTPLSLTSGNSGGSILDSFLREIIGNFCYY